MLNDLNVPEEVMDDIREALDILKRVGCREVYIFGSIADGEYRVGSDIDIAVTGLEKSKYFCVYGELLEKLHTNIDLVVLDYDNSFSSILKKEGRLKRVA